MKHILLACIIALLVLAVTPGDAPSGQAQYNPTINQCEPGSAGCARVDDPQPVNVMCRDIDGILSECVTEPAYPAPGE